MIAVDSSVAIAALASWSTGHDLARNAIEEHDAVLPAHAALETYSVLTRLPEPHRMSAETAHTLIASVFGAVLPQLDGAAHAAFRELVAERGIVGGAVYDALIAVTAASVGRRLLTFDRRAATTYAAVGAEVDILVA